MSATQRVAMHLLAPKKVSSSTPTIKVTDADWNGMVKIKVTTGCDTGATKSYKPADLAPFWAQMPEGTERDSVGGGELRHDVTQPSDASSAYDSEAHRARVQTKLAGKFTVPSVSIHTVSCAYNNASTRLLMLPTPNALQGRRI